MFDFVDASSLTTSKSNVSTYVEHAVAVHDFLKDQKDLSPRNPEVNARLGPFVQETMRARPQHEVTSILNAPKLKEIATRLQTMLGRAEFEMESFCASAFAGKEPDVKDPRYTEFNNFIYTKNYEALIDQEMQAMGWPKKQPPLDQKTESIAFVGAGPLPISAIMLHMRTGHRVTCIDSDAEAVRLGGNLIRHLSETDPKYKSLVHKMNYVHAPGDRHDYVTHPIVFIASLVDRKGPVIMRVLASSDTAATMVVRSAEGLSTLLYQPHQCVAGLEEYNLYFSRMTKPSAEAINTSLVYKIPPGKLRTRNKVDFTSPVDANDMSALRPRQRPMWRTNAKDISI